MNESDDRWARLVDERRALSHYLASLLVIAPPQGITGHAGAGHRWLTFRLEGIVFAIPHDACIAIWPGRAEDLTPVSNPPVGCLGRFDIAGRSYMAIDPAPVFFDIPPVPAARPRSVYLVLDRYGVGLAGDRLQGTVSFASQGIEERSATTRRPWLAGVSRGLGIALIELEGLMRVLGQAPRGREWQT